MQTDAPTVETRTGRPIERACYVVFHDFGKAGHEAVTDPAQFDTGKKAALMALHSRAPMVQAIRINLADGTAFDVSRDIAAEAYLQCQRDEIEAPQWVLDLTGYDQIDTRSEDERKAEREAGYAEYRRGFEAGEA